MMEADYLKRTVGGYLAEGLAEVSAKRPSDPIEYLALWLLKQKQNILNQQAVLSVEIDQDQTKSTDNESVQPVSVAVVAPEEAVSTSEEPVSSSTANDREQTNKDESQNQEEVVPPVSITADVEAPAAKLTRIEEEPDEQQDASHTTSAKDVPEADPSVQEITTDQEQPPPTTQEKDQIIDYQT